MSKEIWVYDSSCLLSRNPDLNDDSVVFSWTGTVHGKKHSESPEHIRCPGFELSNERGRDGVGDTCNLKLG